MNRTMKVFRKALPVCAALFLCLSLCGCAAFREAFSRPSRKHPSDSYKKGTPRKTKPADRDPLKDMFKVQNKPGYLHDKDLSPQERALLDQEIKANSSSEDYIKSIRSDYKSKRQKRHDWVFSR